ncbi:uncharacterized protein O3Q21_006725 [Podargus strigoides]
MAVGEGLLRLDLYGLLGIGEKASEKEVKKAYRQKALTCHPDKNPDNPRAGSSPDGGPVSPPPADVCSPCTRTALWPLSAAPHPKRCDVRQPLRCHNDCLLTSLGCRGPHPEDTIPPARLPGDAVCLETQQPQPSGALCVLGTSTFLRQPRRCDPKAHGLYLQGGCFQ